MTIDELQERFNELRGKKWRTIAGKYPVTFTGFDVGGYGQQIFIEIEQPSCSKLLGLDPLTLCERFHSRPLIEEDTPYADWPIDAKIWVWDTGSEKMKRHFAGIADNGKPKAFLNGYSSWSAPLQTNEWDYAELAEETKNEQL